MAKKASQDKENERAKRETRTKEIRKKKKRARILIICLFFTDGFFVSKKLMK